jgi:hypothetical protein
MNGPADVMIQTEGNVDTKWAQVLYKLLGTARSSRLYHIEWLASTRIDGKGGSVYREDRYECYRVGTELHMGGRRCEEAPRRRDTPWKLL